MGTLKWALGDRVIHKLTGAIGYVVSRTEYFYGLPRYGIQWSGTVEGGKPSEVSWVDEEEVTLSS